MDVDIGHWVVELGAKLIVDHRRCLLRRAAVESQVDRAGELDHPPMDGAKLSQSLVRDASLDQLLGRVGDPARGAPDLLVALVLLRQGLPRGPPLGAAVVVGRAPVGVSRSQAPNCPGWAPSKEDLRALSKTVPTTSSTSREGTVRETQ